MIKTAKSRSWPLSVAGATLILCAILLLGYAINEIRNNNSIFSVLESTAAEQQTEPVLTEEEEKLLAANMIDESDDFEESDYNWNEVREDIGPSKKIISPSKIKVFDMGQENPMASNDNPEGRRKIRRVEIKTFAN